MNETKSSLRLLRRNLSATILLGLLLPLFTIAVLKEDATTVSLVSVVIIFLSVINLGYLKKIESALNRESTAN